MQAARGTAIAPETDRRIWRPRTAVAVMLGLGAALTVLDQAAKACAVAFLREGEPVRVLGPLLQLDLIRNPGAAFSLGTGVTWVFSLLALAALIALLGYAVPRVRVRWWCIAVGMFIAGVTGNLIDRLVRPPGFLRGHVVDFLELPNWPIFNVADMCITGGALVVVAISLFGKLNYDGRPREAPAGKGAGRGATATGPGGVERGAAQSATAEPAVPNTEPAREPEA